MYRQHFWSRIKRKAGKCKKVQLLSGIFVVKGSTWWGEQEKGKFNSFSWLLVKIAIGLWKRGGSAKINRFLGETLSKI